MTDYPTPAIIRSRCLAVHTALHGLVRGDNASVLVASTLTDAADVIALLDRALTIAAANHNPLVACYRDAPWCTAERRADCRGRAGELGCRREWALAKAALPPALEWLASRDDWFTDDLDSLPATQAAAIREQAIPQGLAVVVPNPDGTDTAYVRITEAGREALAAYQKGDDHADATQD